MRSGALYSLTLLAMSAELRANAMTSAPTADAAAVQRCISVTAGRGSWLEKTLWGLYDQEAGWIGADIPNVDGSRDLGPFQINSQWVPVIARRLRRPTYLIERWLRDDACFNVGTAAWLFLDGLRSTHAYWRAIGAYHSPTNWRQKSYAAAVARKIVKRYGPGIFVTGTNLGQPVGMSPTSRAKANDAGRTHADVVVMSFGFGITKPAVSMREGR